MTEPLVTRHVVGPAQLFALAGPWRELHAASSYPSPFTSWAWADAWWRHFCARRPNHPCGCELLVVVAETLAGEAVGIAAFHLPTSGTSPLEPRRLRLLGDTGGGESMTDEPLPLLRAGWEAPARAALLRHLLTRRLPVAWDLLYWRWLGDARDEPSADQLTGGAPELLRGRFWDTAALPGAEIMPLASSWQALRSSLSKSMRDNTAYYPRRLTKHGYEWRVRVASERGELRAAAAELCQLHRARAASSRGVPHKNHLPGVDHAWFLARILGGGAARAWDALDLRPRVALLEVGDRAVAAQAYFEHPDSCTLYYSGFDPNFYDYSPVTILQERIVRDAIAARKRSINLLPYALPWKERWGASSPMATWELVCSSRRPLALARAAARRVSQRLSR